jgi:hypothetical protein
VGETLICRKKKPVILNGRDTCKCSHNSMEVRMMRLFDIILLLELSVNVHRILFILCFQVGGIFTLL